MRRLIWMTVLLLSVLSLSFGQGAGYGYAGPFPDTAAFKLPYGVINVGLGVDPAGKVWVQAYGNSSRDSINIGGGVYAFLRPIYVFNPDGSQASFSPIKILTGPDQNNVTVTDTLRGRLGYGGCINPSNGNFVAVWGTVSSKPGMLLWEINYKTGAGVRRVLSPTGIVANSPASVAVNQDGEYFLAGVLGGIPGQILNPNGTAGTQFTGAVPDIGRAIAVSRNGNDIYVPRFTVWKTYVYHSDFGSLGPYVLKDSIMLGASVESIAIHPTTGHIWSSNDRRRTNFRYYPNRFYAYNPTTKAIVDSFTVAAWDTSSTGPLPRGIAFSPTGDTVYVAHFDVPAVPAVARFIKGLATSVEREPSVIPTGYELLQNYPNPFNPSTAIKFVIAQNSFTTLKVYDLMGREVATLVEKELTAGAYTATFDAKNLPSGTYVYVLSSGGYRLSNKMLLIK